MTHLPCTSSRLNGVVTHDLETVWRTETPHVVSALARRYGDFDAAEDAAQEALLAASQQWPREGMPANPRGWLIRVASRRLIDAVRSDSARRDREAWDWLREPPAVEAESIAQSDDSLTLILLCCHPALTRTAQVSLTLRAVGGLTTAQVARILLMPESTVAQRISRAKSRLREAGAQFKQPENPQSFDSQLSAVLQVLYLIFTEGHSPSAGERTSDLAAASEAIRLTRLLRRLRPADSEVAGLLALMLLTDARRPARESSDGHLIPLAEQDRGRWDRGMIEEGVALLETTLPIGPTGPYAVQAAIAAVHAEAETWGDTDWRQVLALYDLLTALSPGPVVRLNRAVAVAMAHGPDAGLREVEHLAQVPELRRSHRVEAVRAHLLEMAGDLAGAEVAYTRAAARATNQPERDYLNRRAAAMTAEA